MSRHNVGLVGVGYWGPNIAQSLLATKRVNLRWLVDADPLHLQNVSARYPGTHLTTNLEEMLADPELVAVCVATPTATHFDIARRVLESGKHVLVEKPLTASTRETQYLIQLAQDSGKVLMVGHVFIYNAAIRHLKQMIHAGDLGRLHYISMERTNLGPVRTDVNALWDLATHDISIMIDLLDGSPLEVTAHGSCYLNHEVEDVVFLTFSFGDGILVNIHASWLNPKKVRQMVVIGDRQMAAWNDLDLTTPIRVYSKSVQYPPPDQISGAFLDHKTMVVDGGCSTPTIVSIPPLQAECDHFLDCLETGATPLSDGMNALKVGYALEAAVRSMKMRGAPVAVQSVGKKNS